MLPIPPKPDKKVRVSLNDKVSGYLNGKLVAVENIAFVENNNGSDETLTIKGTYHNYLMFMGG